MKKTGKIGLANLKARRRIAEISEERNLISCEIKLPGCGGTFGTAPAHRHKRIWYKGNWEKLSDPKQWVASCQQCHEIIEKDRGLTERIFKELRGKE